MTTTQLRWIETSYNHFALEGPKGLNVARLAKEVGEKTTDFYEHFTDLEVFSQKLLEYHIEQAHVIAEKELVCKQLEDLVEVLVDHKIDLLFYKQLRLHREVPAFEKCFTRVNEFSLPAILPIWAEILRLQDNSYLVELVLRLSLENFFLQITAETINPIWLNAYFDSIQNLVVQFKKTKIKTL